MHKKNQRGMLPFNYALMYRAVRTVGGLGRMMCTCLNGSPVVSRRCPAYPCPMVIRFGSLVRGKPP